MRRVGAQNPSAASQPREGFHRPRRLVKNTFSPALLWSRVDGVARGVYFCHGTGGNESCRKASPCSIWARPACIHGRLACATSRWRSIGPADTRSRLCLARKTPRPYSVSPSMPHDHAAGTRRSSSLRSHLRRSRCFQHYSATERDERGVTRREADEFFRNPPEGRGNPQAE
mgnify:CR=1 FL=1